MMRYLLILLLWLTLSLSAQAEQRLALVIGNSAYDADAGGYLANPGRDADTIATALRGVGFDVDVRKNLDENGIERAIRDHRNRLREAGAGALSFFYYAGHGANDSERNFGGSNYMIPVGASIRSIDDLAIDGVELADAIDSFASAAVSFVVFDACRNFPFAVSERRSAVRGFKAEPSVRGTLIAFSSEPGTTALDDSGYANALATALNTPGLHHVDIFRKVRTEVRKRTNGDQFAWYRDGVDGDIVFKAGLATPTPTIDAESVLWEELQGSCSGLQAYVDRYPSGRFASTARARLNQSPCKAPPSPSLATTPSVETIAPTGNGGGTSRQPGDVFRDCNDCPEMVVIRSGEFVMGSPSGEVGRGDDEGPQRTVQIDYRFAVGKFEVTWAEWEACVADGGCSNSGPDSRGGDEGWGGGSRPVINVSWKDAQAYVQWLSRKTGGEYRLLSEAEWEYVARAGTTGAYWWGGSASHEYANYGSDQCCSGLASGRDRWVNTSPAGSFPANASGLHDMTGNVYEWVEDCYVDSYSGAPTDGSARDESDCSRRVLRGGSWGINPQFLRSASRYRYNPSGRVNFIGFRVARVISD